MSTTIVPESSSRQRSSGGIHIHIKCLEEQYGHSEKSNIYLQYYKRLFCSINKSAVKTFLYHKVEKYSNKIFYTIFLYLSKKLHMGFYYFQHVGCDLIQVLDTTDIHCQQRPLTLIQHKTGMSLIQSHKML